MSPKFQTYTQPETRRRPNTPDPQTRIVQEEMKDIGMVSEIIGRQQRGKQLWYEVVKSGRKKNDTQWFPLDEIKKDTTRFRCARGRRRLTARPCSSTARSKPRPLPAPFR